MRLLPGLAVLCLLACGVRPSCIVLDTTGTREGSKGQQCFVREDKTALRCCKVEGFVNATSAVDGSFRECKVHKAFGGEGKPLSEEGIVLDGKEEVGSVCCVCVRPVQMWRCMYVPITA